MELSHSFSVPVPVEVAWDAFNDLERVAPCFPGAALTSYDGETFGGLVKIKLGPISMQYTGTGTFVERDAGARRAVIEAKGKDKRGNGTASATVTARLVANGDDSTEVKVDTFLSITGKPAQFGRGVMQDVSDKLLGQFAACLETMLSTTASDDSVPDPFQGESARAAAVTGGEEGTRPGSNPPGPEEEVSPLELAGVGTASKIAASKPASLPGTPLEAAAWETVTSDSQGPMPGGGEPPLSEHATHHSSAASDSTQRVTSQPEAGVAELDLGATVLPLLLRRYAPHFIGGLLGLWLLARSIRHRS